MKFFHRQIFFSQRYFIRSYKTSRKLQDKFYFRQLSFRNNFDKFWQKKYELSYKYHGVVMHFSTAAVLALCPTRCNFIEIPFDAF